MSRPRADTGSVAEAHRVDPTPTRDNTVAVVVTYHPDSGVAERIQCAARQVRRLLIVDNRSDDSERAVLKDVATSTPSVELIENQENLGIAAALNRGARRAISDGADWLLMLDQDTLVEPFLLDNLSKAYMAAEERANVKLLAPNYLIHTVGRCAIPPDVPGPIAIPVTTAISSGSLLSLRAFQAVGPMREDFFIDGVDHEYCLRLGMHGYRILMTRQPLMRHAIGPGWGEAWFGALRHVSNHPPVRRYYIMRNRIAIARSYALIAPRFVALDSLSVPVELLLMAVHERDRWAKTKAIARGLWDGLTGRMGRIAPSPIRR